MTLSKQQVEYAITAGEGTLIEYGVGDVNFVSTRTGIALADGHTVIFSRAPEDCQTGK